MLYHHQFGLASADPSDLHAGVLASVLPYGPALSEHCIMQAGLEPGRSPTQQPVSAAELEQLMSSVRGWEAWLDGLKDTAPKGYIAYKAAGGSARASSSQHHASNLKLRIHA